MKQCAACDIYKGCKDSGASWIFFIIGIIATVAMRVMAVLLHVNPAYGKVAWYIGVTGFFLFFMYKYRVNQARARLIAKNGLAEKIVKRKPLEENDYELMSSMLCGLRSKKERINYAVIFTLSAVTLAIALYLDVIRGSL